MRPSLKALTVLVALFVASIPAFTGTAAADAPAPPAITEPATDGQLVHPGDVHMEATGLPGQEEGGPAPCTDWEIRTADSSQAWQALCAKGTLAVHIHLGDGAFVNAYTGHTQLDFGSHYELWARFHDGEGGVSAWSTRSFGTYPASSPGGGIAWTPLEPGYVVDEVAGGLQLPLDIAFVPNPGSAAHAPLAYLTELYGTIKVLRRDGTLSDYATGLLNYNPTGYFPGSGAGGLTGITVDPDSGDVFASMLYDSDPGPAVGPHYPRVVRFHSTDGGLTAASQTTVLAMPGELQEASHQVSNLSIGPDDGKLYVHMGDGFDPTTSQDLDSFRGKILRLNLDGTPVGGDPPDANPFYDASDGITARDYVWAYGFRNPFGGAWRASTGAHYEVENGPSVDRIARVDRGFNYGYDGTDASMLTGALYNWSRAHAPVNVAFVQPEAFGGSGFPASQWDHAFVTESGPTWVSGPQVLGKRIVEFDPDPETGEIGGHPHTLVEYTGTGKATAAGLAAGPDGLYFTELYRDQGATRAIDPGARLLKVRHGPPVPPALARTAPASPADDDTPNVVGTAQFSSTVNLYSDSACHTLIGSGTSDEFAFPGIQVQVLDNTATEIYANDAVAGINSTCTPTPLTYLQETPAGVHGKGFNLKAAKRRCRRKFHGKARRKARHRCLKRAVSKSRKLG